MSVQATLARLFQPPLHHTPPGSAARRSALKKAQKRVKRRPRKKTVAKTARARGKLRAPKVDTVENSDLIPLFTQLGIPAAISREMCANNPDRQAVCCRVVEMRGAVCAPEFAEAMLHYMAQS